MKSLLLLPALLLLLLPLGQGSRPIQLKAQRGPGQVLTDENILDVVKQGLEKQEAKQILQKLFKTKLQNSYMKKSGKGFVLKFKMQDLVKIFSKKYTNTKRNTNIQKRYIFFMNRIQ